MDFRGKMIKQVKVFSALLLISVSLHAFQHQDVKVTKVFAGYDDGRVYFSVDTSTLNPFGCVNSAHYIIDPSRKDINSMLSILLAARTTDATVSVAVEEDQCFDNHPSVHRVAM